MTKGKNVPDYVAIGFEKIDRDLNFLIECLREVLEELGLSELAGDLKWFGRGAPKIEASLVPPKLGLVYSIAFQLLNMVEENAAAHMRALREEAEGLTAERGLWGEQFARMKERGTTGKEIASLLGSVRVEPVLTAHPTEA